MICLIKKKKISPLFILFTLQFLTSLSPIHIFTYIIDRITSLHPQYPLTQSLHVFRNFYPSRFALKQQKPRPTLFKTTNIWIMNVPYVCLCVCVLWYMYYSKNKSQLNRHLSRPQFLYSSEIWTGVWKPFCIIDSILSCVVVQKKKMKNSQPSLHCTRA